MRFSDLDEKREIAKFKNFYYLYNNCVLIRASVDN
jgi:hypothetical protein